MIRTIVATVINRFAVMGFAAAVVLMNTNCLGAFGQGQVALINFDILIMLAVAHYAGGGAIVYLAPRIPPQNMWKPVYAWSLFSAIIGGVLMMAYGRTLIVATLVAMLALGQALYSYHMHVLLGTQRIRAYNQVQIVYAGALATALAVLYLGFGQTDYSFYILGAAIATLLTYALALYHSGRHLLESGNLPMREVVLEMWRYGKFSQSGNVFQILAYRVPYVLINRSGYLFAEIGFVGIFSINTYVSEAIWNVSKSLSLIQYSRLSNEALAANRLKLTLIFFRLSVLISLGPVLVVAFLPASVWQMVLGQGFGLVSDIMPWAAIGILANSASMILSHHFSGSGKHQFNALTSLMACAGVLAVGIWRIHFERDILVGAAQAFSAGMLLQSAGLVILFFRNEAVNIKQLLIPNGDIKTLREIGTTEG